MKTHLTKSETNNGIKFPKCGYKNRNRWWAISDHCVDEDEFKELIKTKPDMVCQKCKESLK